MFTFSLYQIILLHANCMTIDWLNQSISFYNDTSTRLKLKLYLVMDNTLQIFVSENICVTITNS